MPRKYGQKPDKIEIGCRVKLKDLETNEQRVYQVVEEVTTIPDPNAISVHSLLGRALIGKKSNDRILVSEASGQKTYQVIWIL